MTIPSPDAIKGVFTAALTFVDQDFAPDVGACITHCRWLLDNGCDGIGLLGTTGEAASFSVAQRRGLLDAVLEAGIPKERIIVGTGAAALADAVELTTHAADAEVAGCLVVPPFYFKSLTDDAVYGSFATLIEQAGRGDFNLFLYHFPQMSAVPIPHDVIARLLAAYPGILAGLKDSSGDLDNMLALIQKFPAMRIFSGTERYLLPVLEAGGAGCITAGGNVTSAEIGKLYCHWREHGGGDEAEALQDRVIDLRQRLEGFPMVAAMKSLMARHRGVSTLARTVPPLCPLDPAEAQSFADRMEEAGLILS